MEQIQSAKVVCHVQETMAASAANPDCFSFCEEKGWDSTESVYIPVLPDTTD